MNRPVKYRNMFVQVLLFIITFGIYGIYWFYQTACEMKSVTNDQAAEPVLWTILLFIPFASFYACYKHGELYEKVSKEHFSRWLSLLFWIVFSPVVWLLVQMDLNRIAESGQVPQAQ